ncbi:MerR family transcriptional regulator [Herbidospora galbida]|uniref:MerR family transcriptional regulator n=1 Tax=Herbidospora galbida TaxID=2575442 RepID=A0A4U3M7D2_9ACTN|nr:helix-turn-helix domain-containing protein [Herbidospora galbida]TKK84878.1 MerR family transcriptional regulator [Herbidospora galbida]
MDETWTIAELAERATAALAGLAPANGRVSDVPNERLIRYYTTIGLLDPPLARRGRIALYGRRHLLQLVAVKRRQAEGVSNAAIQRELLGATDDRLAELAAGGTASLSASNGSAPDTGVPGGCSPNRPLSAPAAGAESRPRFWTAAPAAAPVGAPARAAFPPTFHGVALTPEAALFLTRPLTDDELAAVARAAQPLIDLLTDLGFTEGIPS